MASMINISIVIGVYNSELTIRETVENINAAVKESGWLHLNEIVLVNDGSKDNSLQVCKEIVETVSNVVLIDLSKNFGQHNAIMSGIKNTTGDYVVMMDDDLQVSANDISKLIRRLIDNDFDIVFGKYEKTRQTFFRSLGTKTHNIMAENLTNKPKEITLTSFYVIKRYVCDEMIKYEGCYSYVAGLMFRVTENIGDVLVEHHNRKIGKSNYTLYKLIKLWLNGFTNFSIKPLRVATLIGLIISTISFISIIYFLVMKITTPDIPMGWTSTIVAISFFGGIQLLSIGLLGEYIGRIFLVLNKAPQYVIKQIYENKDNKDK